MFEKLLSYRRKFKTIVVLGAGSLGGYVIDSLSESMKINELIVYDPDKVEKRNLRNSIYKDHQVGQLKVDALKSLIRNKKIKFTSIPQEFIHGQVQLPRNDMVIDCRDVVSDRTSIDVKTYLSGRHLVIDCKKRFRRDVYYPGRYTEALEKIDLMNSGVIVASLFNDGSLMNLISDQVVYKHDLDMTHYAIMQTTNRLKEQGDFAIDHETRFIDLAENFQYIITANQYKPICIYLDEDHKSDMKRTLLPGVLSDYHDLSKHLNMMIKNLDVFHYYSMKISETHDNIEIMLITETGGA